MRRHFLKELIDYIHEFFTCLFFIKGNYSKWSDIISLCRNHDFSSCCALLPLTLSDVNLLLWNLNIPVALQDSLCLWDPSCALGSYQHPSAWCLFDIRDFPVSFPISSLSFLSTAGWPHLRIYFFSYHLCFCLWGFLFSVLLSMEFGLYYVTCKAVAHRLL